MTVDEALRAAIAGEDAAVYAYGVIGARAEQPWRRRAVRVRSEHQSARSALQGQVSAPVAVPAAFDLPLPVTTTDEARQLAALVEQRLAAVYADLAAAQDGDGRQAAVEAAMACATRAVTWGASSVAFPGA